MWLNPQFTAVLVTFTEEILNRKLHFLCSVITSHLLFYVLTTLREKRSVLGVILVLIFPSFSCIRTEYGVFSPNERKCGKNADQNNSKYGHNSRSANLQSHFISFLSHVIVAEIYWQITISWGFSNLKCKIPTIKNYLEPWILFASFLIF